MSNANSYNETNHGACPFQLNGLGLAGGGEFRGRLAASSCRLGRGYTEY